LVAGHPLKHPAGRHHHDSRMPLVRIQVTKETPERTYLVLAHITPKEKDMGEYKDMVNQGFLKTAHQSTLSFGLVCDF